MLTLQQILDSDSISTLVSKLNINFQSLAISGGGPQGIPGEQGIPGLPGRIGPVGPTGAQGPTGTVVGIIPFGSTAGGSTGPTGDAGPWNTYSYEYLNSYVGTGANMIGQIWIDHWNQGFWQYLDQPDGSTPYTNSPYTIPGVAGVPPGSTGYFGGTGWYFYSLNTETQGNAGDVWINDVTTYQTAPPYAVGPTSSTSTLTVKNARLLSKYGTVWISSGNTVDGTSEDESNLTTPTLFDWGGGGVDVPVLIPQPARFNLGVDRLYFKQSIDTLPYLSNVTARSYIAPSGAGSSDPGFIADNYPVQSSIPMNDWSYWVKPMYDIPVSYYSPLQYYTERRTDSGLSPVGNFGSLGLYMFSSGDASYASNQGGEYYKNIFVYSTRTSITPNENTGAEAILPDDTFNIGEMVLDVKRLSTSNQFVCSVPSDFYTSSDAIDGGYFKENSTVANTVTQGYISVINGKALTGNPTSADVMQYGNSSQTPATGSTALGNYTRSSWYGSAAYGKPSNWSDALDSDNPGNGDSHTNDKLYKIAGMKERGKRTFGNTPGGPKSYLLDELIFYTSGFQTSGTASPNLGGTALQTNTQKSNPVLYLSPYRNVGIGTFTTDNSGVFEPVARLHIHSFLRAGDLDVGSVQQTIEGITGNYAAYPPVSFKGAAVTTETSGNTYLDINLGWINAGSFENANPLGTSGSAYINNLANRKHLDVAIRREAWNPGGSQQIPILRLGVNAKQEQYYYDYSIGATASAMAYEFPFALAPLNPLSPAGGDFENSTPVGVGIHNLYPGARFHMFGANQQNLVSTGLLPFSPGPARLASQGPTGTYPWYTPSPRSNGQVIIDKIVSTYYYPAGVYEYPYEVYNLANGTVLPDATGAGQSPNAANFPFRDAFAPTRSVTPWGLTGRNIAYPSATAAVNGAYLHGAPFGEFTGNLFQPNNYIGFNLFRDLTSIGDNSGATWKLGNNAYNNGGAAIVGSNDGDLAFVNIPSGRDGGTPHLMWDQNGLSTRDVLNNISLLITRKGDIGIGNRPGNDPDAYSSLERNLDTGVVNWVPAWALGTATTRGPVNIFGGETVTSANRPYGLIDYSGITAGFAETGTGSPAALINTWASHREYIRFEVGAEKFYGKNSRSSLRAGYGYPPSTTKTITTNITDYLILEPSYTGTIGSMVINTDFEGRITGILFSAVGSVAFVNLTAANCKALILPHPTEFNAGSGTPWATTGFTAPYGAVAGELNNYVNLWDTFNPSFNTFRINDTSFISEEIGKANVRLNNFVAGEGMNVSTAAGQTAAAAAVKAARQTSPKLILSFLEADGTVIPGSDAAGGTFGGTLRPTTYGAAYRKVNTIIASAQNESSAREYWIPKSDNTGGTFMVWTDHYGQKEKDSGLDEVTVATNRFYVEEVVTLEFVPSYTGASLKFINGTASNQAGKVGTFEHSMPMYVKYFNSQMGNPWWGVTGATGHNEFSTSQYGRTVRPIGATGLRPDNVIYYDSVGTVTGATLAPPPTGTAGGGTGGTAACIIRNVDKYYTVFNSTTNWDNGWNNTDGFENKSSQFRFKRINSDMALVDFNMTIQVQNPDLGSGLTTNSTEFTNVIDNGSPRWTQYLRLTYLPTLNVSNDRDYFMKAFGNSLSFMNFSSYNQWYPGTAIAHDPSLPQNDALSDTGDSNYNYQYGQNTATHNANYTWNGNFIDAVIGANVGGIFGTAANGTNSQIMSTPATRFFDIAPNPPQPPSESTYTSQLIPKFGFAYYNAAISGLLLETNQTTASSVSYAFGTFMGRAYSILGNDYLSRQRSCMWRVVPRIGNNFGIGDPGALSGDVDIPNNSFTLEVKFDKPILHIATPFSTVNFSNGPIGLCNPYQYLTLNGQAMVRYSDTTKTSFSGGTVILGE